MFETILQKANDWLLDNLFIAFIVVIALVVCVYILIGSNSKSGNGFNKEPEGDKITNSVSQSEEPTILVEVSGAVKNPGVYELFASARLIDLINKAGGYDDNASFEILTKQINLAQKLEDGKKLYIPYIWDESNIAGAVEGSLGKTSQSQVLQDQTGQNQSSQQTSQLQTSQQQVASQNVNEASSSTGTSDQKINVNTASADELRSLNGVGEVYAKKIIDNRPYANIDEFYEKSSLSQSLIDKILSGIEF